MHQLDKSELIIPGQQGVGMTSMLQIYKYKPVLDNLNQRAIEIRKELNLKIQKS